MKKYILSILLLWCGYFLQAQEYISLSPNPCTIDQEGGTYTFEVEYSPSPDSLDRLDYVSSHLIQIQIHR